MIYHHQLQVRAINPSSFQFFDLKKNWKNKFIFIKKDVNANIVLFFQSS